MTIIAFLLAGLVAVASLIAYNRLGEPVMPEYEFITTSGEQKRGWCDTRLEVPKCKSGSGIWYEIKQYGEAK